MKHLAIVFTLVAVLGCASKKNDGWDFLHPGTTVDENARILVHDRKFGMRAREEAIRQGNKILPALRDESNDFVLLDNRNSFWIADVMGAIKTEDSRVILEELYSRDGSLQKLVGAVGLAQHGVFPEPIEEDSFLVQLVRTDRSDTATELSIIALGWTRDAGALPCLLDLLEKRPIGYWHHAHACEALERIGSAQAIPVLRECLGSPDFHALPDAFRALIALGDRQAVPLAIGRVSPEIKGYNSGGVVEELERVTGKSYAYNRNKWQQWWAHQGDDWELPKE